MAMADQGHNSQYLGAAFLLVNSYLDNQSNLHPLIRIDEAIIDFRETFHALCFQPVLYYNLTREELTHKLIQDLQKLSELPAAKYVVFHFIGHGGDGDNLFMQDGEKVLTEEILETFRHRLRKETYKFFFIDACRRTGADGPPSGRAYCPALERSLLARSTLPYQAAHTGDTYGIWSKHFLTQLRASMQNLEEILKVVYRIAKEQPSQYTNNGVPDVSWATEVVARGGDLQASPPALSLEFQELSAKLTRYRENLRIRSSNQAMDAHGSNPTKDVTTQKTPSDDHSPLEGEGGSYHRLDPVGIGAMKHGEPTASGSGEGSGSKEKAVPPPPPPTGSTAGSAALPQQDTVVTASAVPPPPPPGGVTAAVTLSTADGRVASVQDIAHPVDVRDALGQEVDARWKQFGTFLRCDPSLIEIIDNSNKGSTACMVDLVAKWVNGDEGTGRLPRTWQTVVQAVRGSGCRRLAEELAEKYGVTLTRR